MESKISIITKREFLTHIKKKSFIVMTFLAPFLITAAVALIAVMMNANRNTQTNIAVIDNSQLFHDVLKSDKQLQYSFYKASDEKALLDTLDNSEYLSGVMIIPAPKDSTFATIENGTKIFTNTSIGLATEQKIKNSLDQKIEDLKLKELGIEKSELKKAQSNVVFTIKNAKDGTEETSNSFVRRGISIFLLFIIYTFILVYGMRVMRSVMEEKSNRVIEIIISSVKPFDLMMGKILGTTLVAFFQFGIWLILGLIMTGIAMNFLNPDLGDQAMMQQQMSQYADVAQIQQDAAPIIKEFQQLNLPLILFCFLFYFVFGYLFYSSILASIGAAVDSETETQQFMPFILVPLMLGFYGSLMIFENPEGPVGTWLSIIPITSPLAMIARIPFGVPTWQLILSMVLLIISVYLMVKLSAQVYRIGILMYGQKTNLKEVWKWIRKGY